MSGGERGGRAASPLLNDVVFSFLDVETTGLSPMEGHRVCEVAVLRTKGGRILDHYSSLLHPGRPIPPEAGRINGISDEMVAFSPAFADIAAKLRQKLEQTAVVCHNAPFDVAFLEAEFGKANLSFPAVPVLDTLTLARKHFKFERNSLGAISKVLGVETQGWHRASNDVFMLKLIFDKFLEEFSRNGIRTLSELLIIQ